MMAAYRARKWDEAARWLGEARREADDRLHDFYALYAARIEAMKNSPPEAGWDGVYVAASK
jgi:hypothetical protein